VGLRREPALECTDDGVGLHYVGTELVEAVAELPNKSAWRIEAGGAGAVTETRLPTRLLGDVHSSAAT
jgi:hypothetical protein